jgi:hypothetical protein
MSVREATTGSNTEGSIPATFRHHIVGPTQPPIQCVLGGGEATGILPPGLRYLHREADQSPPTSTEVMNAWRFTSTSIHLNGVV